MTPDTDTRMQEELDMSNATQLAATPTTGPADGTLTSTTFIQRLNTTGGLAPAGGCDATLVGATAPVAYTADYYFYRAA